MTAAKTEQSADVVIIGAGIAGIATAYYLRSTSKLSVMLIDSRQPMSYTSAQSGDNYRNWWPQQTMADFTNDSIDELDRFARESDNLFKMTRGGYALATRDEDIDEQIAKIPGDINIDVVAGRDAISKRFPSLDSSIANVLHIRRGGDISSQQLGQYLLQRIRGDGFTRLNGTVVSICQNGAHKLEVLSNERVSTVTADCVVNAAGPFVQRIAEMLNESLPVKNIYQQKIAFEDTREAVPRDMPFSIDLDGKQLDWSDEERSMLKEEPELEWLLNTLPGGTHCRPDGGLNGSWVKLGWAYNAATSDPLEDMTNEPAVDPHFPEIVIRSAATMIPSLKPYVAQPPTRMSHYGGYYTMTDENWPLIGPMNTDGAFVVGALSGFGSMSACAAGKICAAYITGATLPGYARDLSMSRLQNPVLLDELRSATNKGLL